MDKFKSTDKGRAFLVTLVSWWHDRHGFIFCLFAVKDTPKMNQAEVIHPGWVHRNHGYLSLLDTCQADVCQAVELKTIKLALQQEVKVHPLQKEKGESMWENKQKQSQWDRKCSGITIIAVD